jgi:hypothetical protein
MSSEKRKSSSSYDSTLYQQFLLSITFSVKVAFCILEKMDATTVVSFSSTLKEIAFKASLLFCRVMRIFSKDIPADMNALKQLHGSSAKEEDQVHEAALGDKLTPKITDGEVQNQVPSATSEVTGNDPASNEIDQSADAPPSSSDADWVGELLIFFHDILGKHRLCCLNEGKSYTRTYCDW